MDQTMLATYVGRREFARDRADAQRMAGLAALLDHDVSPWAPGVLPPLGHWLCFHPQARQSVLAADGHPVRTDDGLLPAGDLPRRMWAGSRIHFLRDIPLDAPIERTSTLIAATPKTGRSGRMVFATVRHEIAVPGEPVAIVDEHDIVYREAATPGGAAAAPAPADAPALPGRRVVPDPVMLFRYSALTFNGHRIHYDRDYTRDVEGYPGLVVHGPLIATLLLDTALRRDPGRRIARYAFRAAAPAFDGDPLGLAVSDTAEGLDLVAHGPGGVRMRATATFG